MPPATSAIITNGKCFKLRVQCFNFTLDGIGINPSQTAGKKEVKIFLSCHGYN